MADLGGNEKFKNREDWDLRQFRTYQVVGIRREVLFSTKSVHDSGFVANLAHNLTMNRVQMPLHCKYRVTSGHRV